MGALDRFSTGAAMTGSLVAEGPIAGANTAILDGVTDAVAILDARWRFVYLNAAAVALFRRDRADLLGNRIWDLFPTAVNAPSDAPPRRALEAGRGVTFELPYPEQSFCLEMCAYPLATGFVAYLQDITARKAAEVALRFQAQLLDHVEAAVIATDPTGRVTHWNAHAAALYGWTGEEALGRPIGALTVGPHDPADTAATWARLKAGLTWAGEFTARRKDGTTFPAHVTNGPIHDPDGRLVGIVGVSVDISERKAAEEALRR